MNAKMLLLIPVPPHRCLHFRLSRITIPIEMIMHLNIGIRKSLHLFLESKTDERDRARAHAP